MPEVVELYVVMYCEACADSVKRVVKRIPGVESYKIDYVEQKVTVVGNVDREDVWRRIHRTGRYVTLIPKPLPPPKVEEPKKVEQEEKKEETKVEDVTKETTTIEEKTTTEIKVEEITIEDTKAVESKEEVKVIEVKEEVATVVETHEDDEEEDYEEEEEGEEQEEEEQVVVETKKEPEKPKPIEWVPMFVTAPYYTLPSRFY